MKQLHDFPAAMLDPHSDRAIPPGGGLLIAVAISLAFWGALAVAIL